MRQGRRRRRGGAAGLLLCVLLAGGILWSAPAAAAGETAPDPDAVVDELLRESGVDSLFSLLPEEGRELLEEQGVDSVTPEALLDLSFWDLLAAGWNRIGETLTAPLGLLAASVGVILLCALLQSMQSSFQGGTLERVFSAVSTLCISTVIMLPVTGLIRQICELLDTMSRFLLGFVPVYLGILTASGKPVSAAAYGTGVMGAAQVVAQLSATVLAPLLGIYLAFCLIGGASPEIHVDSIAKTVQSAVIAVLGLLLTVFVGLLSVQGVIAASADTLTMKTARFAVGSFLPVVGGALAEALSTIQSCMGVVRSVVGGFGIAAIAAAFLPPVLTVLCMKGALFVAGGVGDALGTSQAAGLLRAASSALTLLLGLVLVFGMLFVVSLSIMLVLANG